MVLTYDKTKQDKILEYKLAEDIDTLENETMLLITMH